MNHAEELLDEMAKAEYRGAQSSELKTVAARTARPGRSPLVVRGGKRTPETTETGGEQR